MQKQSNRSSQNIAEKIVLHAEKRSTCTLCGRKSSISEFINISKYYNFCLILTSVLGTMNSRGYKKKTVRTAILSSVMAFVHSIPNYQMQNEQEARRTAIFSNNGAQKKIDRTYNKQISRRNLFDGKFETLCRKNSSR